MRILAALLLLFALALPARAQTVVADLNQANVAINTTFKGSSILVFGAITRDQPVEFEPFDVIVAIEGPKAPLTVRRKERVGGIWVNRKSVGVAPTPVFYALNSTAPLNQILSEYDDETYHVSLERALGQAQPGFFDPEPYLDAVIAQRLESGAYQINSDGVTIRQNTLLRSRIELPANLVEGLYTARIYLTRDKRMVSAFTTSIVVQKVGLGQFLYSLAQDHPLRYGVLALFLAIASGWGASAVFRMLQR